MSIEVKAACDRRTLKDFHRLPSLIYRGDEQWVPPLASEVKRVLDAKRNPYFANASLRLFVCYRDEHVVARTAVVINRRHWERFGTRTAFFGFFESFYDVEGVQALFEEVRNYCRGRGAEFIEGPFNPNHYSELGVQISGFETPPAFFQSYNKKYYLDLLENAGFRVSKLLHTAKRQNVRQFILDRYGDRFESGNSSGYLVRTFRKEDFWAELERIRKVFNDAFCPNWHFLPLTKDEYRFSAKFLNLVTMPELIIIVEHHGQAVGVLQCVQNINPLLKQLNGTAGPLKFLRYQHSRKSVRDLIVYAVGIKRSYQHTRVYSLLLREMCRLALQCDTLEATWMSEDNAMANHAAGHVGLLRDKEFVIVTQYIHGNHHAANQAKDLLRSDNFVTTPASVSSIVKENG